MALILDTNALSALADGDLVLRRAIEHEPDYAVPVVVLGEYLFGIRRSRHRPRYELWLETLLPQLEILSVVRRNSSSLKQSPKAGRGG
jgi:tRNA(fMet)-specific endonuclease VapC